MCYLTSWKKMTHGEQPTGMVDGAQEELLPLPPLSMLPHLPSPNRHSLQQVLLLCSGIVVMVLLSLFVE